MKLLLDTHAALWWVNEHEKLSSEAKALLLNDAHTLYLSIASAWEIAIKVSLGKLTELRGGVRAFLAKIERIPVRLLPIEPRHVAIAEFCHLFTATHLTGCLSQ
ncbi:MAG: type II toxin-antitoxin system VapC family toxin [Synergistaceae bacterium]|nr:type II toxin-antitoxin system VapC family toxin [Synergistaceae bacterium]